MSIETIAEEISSLYSRLYLLFYRRRDPRAYRPRPEALAVMEHLFSSGPLTVSEAAKHFNRSPSAISEHIDRLVKQGLLSRLSDERDRRRKLVWLSPKGFALLEVERQVLDNALLTGALETMTEEQRGYLVAGLSALADGAIRSRERLGTPLQRKNR